MKIKSGIELDLMPYERKKLRANKIKIRDIPKHSIEELCVSLKISAIRAMEIHALVEFQSIPSIGIKFAWDLISLGYYSLDELKEKNASRLFEDLEFSTGTRIDPCVEDQFLLVVYYANNRDNRKRWWNFTEERKKYRIENGYPANRPKKAWFEFDKIK